MVLFKKIISSPHQLVGRQNGKRVVPLQVFHNRLTVPTGQEPRIQDYRDPGVRLGPDEAANSLPEPHRRFRQLRLVERILSLSFKQAIVSPVHNFVGRIKRQPGNDQEFQGRIRQVNTLPETGGPKQQRVFSS